MASNAKTAGAVVGAVGAQVFVVGTFALFAGDCDCVARIVCTGNDRCLWGLTLWEYWAGYGTVASAVFAILGYLIAGDD